MKELQASVPIKEAQYDRLIAKRMSLIGRNGYPAITPWIDDARKLPPDLTKPAPANRWRYTGLDAMFTLYRAAYLLKDQTPKSLLALKAELLAAADKDDSTQHQAQKVYDDRIGAVVLDVERCNAAPQVKGFALAALAGVSPQLSGPFHK